jgi:hypothetical protein
MFYIRDFPVFEALMIIEFNNTIIFWRGPAPFYFVPVPAEQSSEIKEMSNLLTYGWGVIPVEVRIGKTEFKTSLFPKDGLYLVPIKAIVRKAEKLEEGDEVDVHLRFEIRQKDFGNFPQEDKDWESSEE